MADLVKQVQQYWYLLLIGMVIGFLVSGWFSEPVSSFDIARDLCESRDKSVNQVSISGLGEGTPAHQRTIYYDDIVVSCSVDQ